MSKLLDNLGDGFFPTVPVTTDVTVKNSSLVNIGLVLFVTFCLILFAWYTFKKAVK